MGFVRFRRTFKLLPGNPLNISKGGPSLSFGGRGFHYTIGRGQRRTTVGMPGTGMSYTEISKASRSQGSNDFPAVGNTRPIIGKPSLWVFLVIVSLAIFALSQNH